MDSGRREKRNPQKLVVLLSNGAKPVDTEWASTENVSTNGARVRTVRRWKPNTRVLVKSPLGELRAGARVVYCQTLPDTTFAVGLEYMSCQSCGSENLHKFEGEIAIHFSGWNNLDKPHVYVSSEIVICLDCGAAQFAIQEAELRLLYKGNAAAAG